MSAIALSVIGRWALLSLSGEFDLANSSEISAAIDELVSEDVTDITVDLGGVTFFDVKSINALITGYRTLTSAGGRMVLVGVSPLLDRILVITGLDAVLAPFRPAAGLAATDLFDSHGSASLPFDDDPLREDLDFTIEFYALSRLLASERRIGDELHKIVRAAVAGVPGCTAASVAIIAQGVPRTAATSNRVAIEVDVAQYVVEEGPCLEAAQVGRHIRVDVLEVDESYPHFAALAVEVGIHSTLSAPLFLGDETVGSLNLYSSEPNAFTDEGEAIATLLAAQAASSLHESVLYSAARRLTRRLQQRSDDDREIAMAEGVLSARHYCSISQARRLLHSAAVGNRQSLVQTARRLINRLEQEFGPPWASGLDI